jgi:DNA polymerase-3 subunit gamma/tau
VTSKAAYHPSPNPLPGERAYGAVTAIKAEVAQQAINQPKNIEDVVALLQHVGEHILAGQVFHYVHPVKMSSGRIEIALEPDAPTALSHLGKVLSDICGSRWMVVVSSKPGKPTLAELERKEKEDKFNTVSQLPLAKEIMTLFPGAEIVRIYDKTTEDS